MVDPNRPNGIVYLSKPPVAAADLIAQSRKLLEAYADMPKLLCSGVLPIGFHHAIPETEIHLARPRRT